MDGTFWGSCQGGCCLPKQEDDGLDSLCVDGDVPKAAAPTEYEIAQVISGATRDAGLCKDGDGRKAVGLSVEVDTAQIIVGIADDSGPSDSTRDLGPADGAHEGALDDGPAGSACDAGLPGRAGDARPPDALGETKASSNSVFNNLRQRRNERLVDAAIDRAQIRAMNGPLPETADPAVDIFIKAKLQEWDRDHTGVFNREEVHFAMEELRSTMNSLATLKWQVIVGTGVLTVALLLGLGAAVVAYAMAQSTSVSGGGQLQQKGSGNSVVTTVLSGVGDISSVLSFDEVTDQWTLDDASLRDLESVSFTATNGTFYHFKVAELRRFDSGPNGNTDQLDIVTDGGHQLRFVEMSDGFSMLEVKWKGSPLWSSVETSASGRLLEAMEDQSLEDEEDEEGGAPRSGGAVEPPPRLLSKGHYVGGVFVHSRGGRYRCDPAYIDGYHNPDYYCDGASRFGHLLWPYILAAAALLGCASRS